MAKKTLSSDLLVVGAGISGISTALEAAETGYTVTLIEKNPYVGGRVVQLNQYFPKLCPPTCGIEINLQRIKKNSRIKLLTLSEVESIEGDDGQYKVAIKQKPRYVTANCTSCGDCVEACPVERDNAFNFGMDKTKAIYLPYNNAYPMQYVVDEKACKFGDCRACVDACPYDAIDLDEEPTEYALETKSIVFATGWDPYDAKNLVHLGFGEYPGVITNVMMERLSAPSGPTQGRIVHPATGKEIDSIAFVQCAGSRDENHLEYCSSVCCLASLKQARYVREQYPEMDIHIHYIDIRSPGIFEEFYQNSQEDDKLHLHRGKIAKVFKQHGSDKLIVEAENTLSGELNQSEVDMVVLATGMEPAAKNIAQVDKAMLDRFGFFRAEKANGMMGSGVASRPKDVADAVRESTGAAVKAIHTIKGEK
ncbi:MAG: FAD-dependent oxidoreductase [Candidatus Kapaibacterium sp.]